MLVSCISDSTASLYPIEYKGNAVRLCACMIQLQPKDRPRRAQDNAHRNAPADQLRPHISPNESARMIRRRPRVQTTETQQHVPSAGGDMLQAPSEEAVTERPPPTRKTSRPHSHYTHCALAVHTAHANTSERAPQTLLTDQTFQHVASACQHCVRV